MISEQVTSKVARHVPAWAVIVGMLGFVGGECAGSENGERGAGAVRVILDTDLSSDCGDAGAVALLHALADAGEAEIMGMVLNGRDRAGASAATLDAINTYYGRPDLPIGVARGRPVPTASPFTGPVRDGFPHDQPSDAEVQTGAVALYRELLASAPDGGVGIVSIGYLANLRGLLESKGDDHSKLDGKSLVKAKVNRLTVMGGEFPGGSEFHFRAGGDPKAAGDAAEVLRHWPDEVEVVFAGFEVGRDVMTGRELSGARSENPLKKIYGLSFDALKFGRPSWDQIAVLHAVRGKRDYWDTVGEGSVEIGNDGANRWVGKPDRNQKYLVRKMPAQRLGFVIGELISRPSGSGGEALVGHWKMDGTGEDSAGGNHAKPENGAAFSGGGKVLKLDGADDYLEIPAAEALALSGYSISVRVKVKKGDEKGWWTVFEHGREADNWYGLWRHESGERFHFRWGRDDTADFSAKIRPGEWQHLVVTVDPGEREVRLYQDGVPDRTIENIRVPRPGQQVMKVGCNVYGNEFFAGEIDDLRIYRRPLSDAEVAELAKGNP